MWTRRIVLLLVIAAGYWLWYGLTQRSINGDDGISILAAQSILRHGYPLLPSGILYHRAYLANYLLAGSIGLFGPNDFGIMLPSLLMSLGSLWLVFRFATEAFKRPAAGVLAAGVLLALQSQTFYATGARMYMAVQFFTVLAGYCAWRGFAQGRRPFQWLTGLAMAAAILSHQQGGAVLVMVPVAVWLIRRMQGRHACAINRWVTAVGFLVLCGVFFVATVYKPPIARFDAGARDWEAVPYVQLNVQPERWWAHILEVESTVPFGVLLLPVVLVLAVRAARRRAGALSEAMVFACALLAVNAVAIMGTIYIVDWRFWFQPLPFYALLLSVAFLWLTGWWRSAQARGRWHGLPKRVAVAWGLAGWVAIVLLVSGLAFGPGIYLEHIRKAYGLPCGAGNCVKTIEEQYAALRPVIGAEDVLISSNEAVTSYYLGRVDGFLRERVAGPEQLEPFERRDDMYYGVPLIDTAEELTRLARDPRRVWVFVDYKVGYHSSSELLKLLDRTFTTYRRHEALTVYVNVPPG